MPLVLFTHDVKKIKGAAQKNGEVYGVCKRALKCKTSRMKLARCKRVLVLTLPF